MYFLIYTPFASAAVWQWSVPVPSIDGRRAYLWIPPDCSHVRGLVVACQNMLEQPLFERPAFRAACADNGLGLVLIFPGHDKDADDAKNPDHPVRSYLDIFLNRNYPTGPEDPKSAGVDLQKALDDLAAESGYTEIKYAPLMPVGHSSAGSFVWHLYQWDPSRIFAMMPFKTAAKDDGPEGIPIFDINSEWFEYGKADMHNVSMIGLDGGAPPPKARTKSDNILYGYYVDLGCGHCDVSDDSIGIMSLWLKKVVSARIPENASPDGPVPLKSIALESGWLLDPSTLGKPGGKPIAFADWKGDPRATFWYLDKELAGEVQDHMAAQLAKKPQQIGLVKNGVPDPDARMSVLGPQFLDDGATFKIQAGYLDHIEHAYFADKTQGYYPMASPLSHGNDSILYRVNSGGITQVGPDTFRICPRSGPLLPQGNPWEPTLVAYSLGDESYRPAEHPIHVNINIFNKDGEPQTLDFTKIPDQSSRALRPIKLLATASSNLPIQFIMVSGPAAIEGDSLKFEPMPVRAKYPIRVLVSAFQWGRQIDPKIQSAGPVTVQFFIQK